MTSSNAQANHPACFRDLLQLIRLPNMFTALADVTMGYLFVQGGLHPLANYLVLALASLLLYAAGMVLNDLWDIEQDRRERPERHWRRGAFRCRWLGDWGSGCCWAASSVAGPLVSFRRARWHSMAKWRSRDAAGSAGCWYDAKLKRTPLGPLAMGGCRALNVLLGMSLAVQIRGCRSRGWVWYGRD